jgi:branched-chain amino acid transport system permease protein
MRLTRFIPYAVGAAVAVVFPLLSGVYTQQIAITILLYMALAVTWDMILRSGQLSFGTAGFFGLGSYAAVLLFLRAGLHPVLGILLGGVFAGVVALLVGLAVLKLRGMYFAIVTLALAGIFNVVTRNFSGLTGGPEGLMLPSVIFGGDSVKLYWLALSVAVLAIIVSEIFEKSRVRFASTSIRNDERVAKSSGIHVFWYLVFVFALSSAIQGIAGGTYAQVYGFVSPEGSFHANFLLLPLAMALLGGIHSTWGPVIGALLLGVMGEYLKLQIPYGHLLVYGGIIVLVTLFLPKGVVGAFRARLRPLRMRREAE